jgi:hypothetical protein
MPQFVSIGQAKDHLGVTLEDSDPDLHLKITQASAIILDYLKSRGDAAWTEDNAPGPVQAATLLMLGHLYEHRGDDMKTDADLWEAIRRLLERSRDPAFA